MTTSSVYGGISASKTRVEPKDFELEDESKALLKGGFHYGKNMRGVIYIPPRPLLNHGVHRCMRPPEHPLPLSFMSQLSF